MTKSKSASKKKKRYYQTMIGDDYSGIRNGRYHKTKYTSHRKRK